MEELIIREREFKENLVQVINNAGLPAFAIKPILKDIFEQVDMLEQRQYAEAKQNADKKKEKAKKTETKGKEA